MPRGAGDTLPPPCRRDYRERVDAKRRAALNDLRRRVYGPEGAHDPETLDRLRVLEEELHRDVPPTEAFAAPALTTVTPETATVYTATPPRARDAEPPAWRRTVPTAVGAVVIVVVALALSGVFGRPPAITTHAVPAAEARALAADAGAVMLQRIVVLSGFDLVPLPEGEHVPAFPTDGTMQWAVLVAHSHGWAVWIAGADGERGTEHCLAAEREDEAWARCVLADDQDDEVLAVTVPGAASGRGGRPLPGERLGFWWSAAERAIYVVRTTTNGD
ncbi:hypothetical protein SAMN04487751_1849 [Microbacterium saccharophilum]|uniref:Uncharacterized protein n=1 Tax=Microbacterium saccharophilum TaxID=1213358 RepID=A0A7Z7GD44_9MICO|nr:hypothetical protein SAMN04487751_1849 [Microbacterium saccharophilum]